MDVSPSLIPHPQSPVAVEPSKGPLHHPAMLAESRGNLDPTPRNPGNNATMATGTSAGFRVIRFVRMQLLRSLTRPSATRFLDRRHDVQDRLQHPGVMHVRPGARHPEREAVVVDEEVVFRASLAAVGRVRPGFRPLLEQVRSGRPTMPGSHRSDPPRPGGAATAERGRPTPQLGAIPVAVASRSSRSHIPSPGAAAPKRSRF